MQVKAVIFDLDGLMLETEELAREIWLSQAREKSLPLNDTVYHSLIGRSYPDIERMVAEAFAGRADARAYIAACLEIYRARIELPIPTRPGLAAMLDFCDARGFLKSVGTSSGRSMAVVKLRSGGIDGRFPILVTATEVAHGKPAPDIFLKCAELMGVVPAECVVLEDSPSGIAAARAAGMRSVMVPDMIEPSAEVRAMTSGVLRSLAEAPAFFARQAWV